ncbi:heterokaryon incompatibility protein-domain-containing protein [Xylaria flabelliformis]|nr:heterokaryon incompatibility protein-domain-containing protein [Xylaria flabelliformis]
MDVRDDRVDFISDTWVLIGLAIVDTIAPAIDHAWSLYLADCGTTTPTRHVVLFAYVIFILVNMKNDVRWSTIQSLSLVLLWFCFYNNRDFSLMSLYGAYLITKVTLMTFGNASLWLTIPGVRFDAHSIVLGNLRLATYLLSWAALIMTGWVIKYCTRPFQKFPAFPQAIIATAVVQTTVIGIDKMTSSSKRQPRRYHSLDDEEPVSDAQIDENTASMYAQSGELASGRTIRLIKLLPRTNGEEISCEIENCDLEDLRKDYEAVSYTWGEGKRQAIIKADGRPIRISQKVFEILSGLRHDWKPRKLWIDYICINQHHTTEKSHQVTMMRYIYYRASNVIIWLDPLPDTAVAVDLLLEISRSPGLTGMHGAHLYGQRHQQYRLLALARFMENDYFNRLWVLQEIASARYIKILCGDQSIEWEDLRLVIIFLGNPEMLRCLQSTEEMGIVACNQDSLRHAGTILATKTSASTGTSYSLAFLLSNYRSMKCKDPRDKVFGLLGLVRGIDHPLIRPDYNKDEIEVYKDTAKYVFTVEGTSRTLIALAFAGVGQCRRLQELPSWVPDWASNVRIKRVEGGDEAEADDLPPPKQSSFSYHLQPWSAFGNGFDIMKPDQSYFESTGLALGYQAALDSKTEVRLIDDDVLGVRGFVVDEIASLTSVFDIPFDERMRISHTVMTLTVLAWFEEAEALAVSVPTPYPTNQNIEDVLWRTLIGDRLLGTEEREVIRPAPSSYGQLYRSFKGAAIDLRQTCSFMSMETVTEMRDIWHQVFTQILGGESMLKTFVEVLCGRSGHPHVWAMMTAGTRFANDDEPRPEFPREDDGRSWEERLEELCEKEDMKHLFDVLIALIAAFSPEQSPNNPGALGTDASQQIADAVSQAPLVAQFSEGLRISFERRLCVTKNGYMGLVPPLTHVGDLVSIFFGGDAPFLVRPETNPVVAEKIGVLRCRLVGECYMHGMMDGEMVGLGNTPLWFHLT